MKISLKILVLWLVLVGLLRLSLLAPHRYLDDLGLITIGLQLFLSIVCGAVALKSTGHQRFVYFNFSFLFGYIILLTTGSFVGLSLFKDVPHVSVFHYFYVSNVGFKALILVSIFFPILAYRFTRLSVAKAYLATFGIALSVIVILYGSLLADPLRLYHNQDYEQLGPLRESYDGLIKTDGREPTSDELALDFSHRAKLDVGQSRIRVQELKPYLVEGGETIVFWRPVQNDSILINLICLAAITSFLASVYGGRHVTSAYLDKVMAGFFLYSGLDTFHLYARNVSGSIEIFHGLFAVGQYFTIALLLLMAYAFSLRLRFVLSELGQYYEKVLQVSPEKLTQWKDEIDIFILKTFFPKKTTANIALITNPIQNKS